MNDLKIINIGWLIDGSGDPVRKNVQLRVVGGHIDAVVKNSPRKSDSKPDKLKAETLDLADATILPATFIAVKGDPSGLPDSLRHIQGVWVKGESIG